MSDFIRWVEGQLKAGYSLAHRASGGYYVVYQGTEVRMPNGATLRITDNDGHHYRRRTLQHLVAAGAAERPVRKTTKARTTPRPIIRDPKTAFVLSMEVLRDPQASPRERRLARAYQEVMQSNEELRLLAQRLAMRLRELGG